MHQIWIIGVLIFVAGAVGGVVNALMTDNGFMLPTTESTSGSQILRPGFLGNVVIGAVAALVSWGLYGPMSAVDLFSSAASGQPTTVGLTLASLVGAVLVGIGGARWLSNEVDKKLLRAAASEAAKARPSARHSEQMVLASPAKALTIAKNLAAQG